MPDPAEITVADRAEELARAIVVAKQAEAAQTAARRQLEDELIALLGHKDEGSETHRLGAFKITTTARINRSVDADALAKVRDRLPPALLDRLIDYKPSLRKSELTYIQNNEPEVYAIVAPAIIAKPGKASVSVEMEGE